MPVKGIIFLISNKFYWYQKKDHPSTQGVYKGSITQRQNYKNQGNQNKKGMIGFA